MLDKSIENEILNAQIVANTIAPNVEFTVASVYEDYIHFSYSVNGNDRMGPCIDRKTMKQIYKDSYEFFIEK